jgi:hypothetical protein
MMRNYTAILFLFPIFLLFLEGCSEKKSVKTVLQGQSVKEVDLVVFKAFHNQEITQKEDVRHKSDTYVSTSEYYNACPELSRRASLEERLVEIPMPLGSRSLAPDQSHGRAEDVHCEEVRLLSTHAAPLLVQFYRREMEILGWRELVIFEGDSTTVCIFENPQRWAAITIQSYTEPSWWGASTPQFLILVQLMPHSRASPLDHSL